MKKLLLLFLLTLAAASSQAQKIPPTPIDLRSAYCVKLYQNSIKLFEFDLAEVKKTDSNLYLSTTAFVEKLRNDLNKLQNYLLPRTKFLALEGLITAAEQFGKDDALTESCINRCTDNKIYQACRAACNVETGFNNRNRMCSDLSWLPY